MLFRAKEAKQTCISALSWNRELETLVWKHHPALRQIVLQSGEKETINIYEEIFMYQQFLGKTNIHRNTA